MQSMIHFGYLIVFDNLLDYAEAGIFVWGGLLQSGYYQLGVNGVG